MMRFDGGPEGQSKAQVNRNRKPLKLGRETCKTNKRNNIKFQIVASSCKASTETGSQQGTMPNKEKRSALGQR
jgi:hypothetical protein